MERIFDHALKCVMATLICTPAGHDICDSTNFKLIGTTSSGSPDCSESFHGHARVIFLTGSWSALMEIFNLFFYITNSLKLPQSEWVDEHCLSLLLWISFSTELFQIPLLSMIFSVSIFNACYGRLICLEVLRKISCKARHCWNLASLLISFIFSWMYLHQSCPLKPALFLHGGTKLSRVFLPSSLSQLYN